MYNKIINGKIEDIQNVFFESKNGTTQAYSLLSLNDGKKYKIKGIVKGFNKGSIIYLVERNKYAKFYDVINKKTLKMMKIERFIFGTIGITCSIGPILVIYNLFLYKMAYLSYIINGGFDMLFPLVTLTFISIFLLFDLPSNKIIKEVKNIINEIAILK